MAHFIALPMERLSPEILTALLEEFASRDGTDYGAREFALDEKVSSLTRQLGAGDLKLLFDTDSEQWDLVPRDVAERLLANESL